MTPTIQETLCWLVVSLGVLLGVTATGVGLAAARYRAEAVVTQATVLAMERRESVDRDGRVSTAYAPVFEFALPDGSRRTVRATTETNPPCCTVGETIAIRYDPRNPDRASRIGLWEDWGWTGVLGLLGAGFLGLGGLGVVQFRRLRVVERIHGWTALPVTGVTSRRDDDGTSWTIHARWTDPLDGRVRDFESDALRTDPTPHLAGAGSVRVLFDPLGRTANYLMDTGFLPRDRR